MSIEEFNNKNVELQQKIKEEIEKVEAGKSSRNLIQLQTILEELRMSNKIKEIPLSYPRIISDSWDYPDTLGIELMELAEIYKRTQTSHINFSDTP